MCQQLTRSSLVSTYPISSLFTSSLKFILRHVCRICLMNNLLNRTCEHACAREYEGSTRSKLGDSLNSRTSCIRNNKHANRNKKKREINSKVYSPPCAAITSCSTRGACSPVGCSHRLEYASWGQATICQIRPIAHVRCIACYFRVCASRMFHACNTSSPSPRCANFRKAPQGIRLYYRLALSERGHVAKRARTWHRFAKCSLRFSPRPCQFSIPLTRRVTEAEVSTAQGLEGSAGATTPVSNRLPRKNFEKLSL